ncbi:hypothetical protein ES703_64059 [subsurface metagenome]
MKLYEDIDWSKVERHFRNLQLIYQLQQASLIDKDEADVLVDACKEKLETFLVPN